MILVLNIFLIVIIGCFNAFQRVQSFRLKSGLYSIVKGNHDVKLRNFDSKPYISSEPHSDRAQWLQKFSKRGHSVTHQIVESQTANTARSQNRRAMFPGKLKS